MKKVGELFGRPVYENPDLPDVGEIVLGPLTSEHLQELGEYMVEHGLLDPEDPFGIGPTVLAGAPPEAGRNE